MGQFANNIEMIWGMQEVLIAGPKDYVKYTDAYRTRSHINFEAGTITIETLGVTRLNSNYIKRLSRHCLWEKIPALSTSTLM